MKKLAIFIVFIIALVLLYTSFAHSQTPKPTTPAPTVTSRSTLAPTNASFGTPVRFQIPRLGVDTQIEEVGMDAKGNMDVPKDADNVAWYDLGHKIGSQGSAVIAAHYDKPDGSPAVFYHLVDLQNGDVIKVTDDKGTTLSYQVIDAKAYPYDNFPLQQVFNTTDMPRLNLITCDGTWDKSKHTYDKRLVVYSRLSPKSNS